MKKIFRWILAVLLIVNMSWEGVACSSKYTKDLITVYTSKNRDFKVLQLSDLHLTNDLDGAYANSKPDETYANITQIISQTNPNLIVLTGDIFFHNLSKLQEFKEFMDSFKINWTFTFGNHDALTIEEKIEIANGLESSKYCLFRNEYQNIETSHMGDHIILLKTKWSKKLRFAFYFFDSGIHQAKPDGKAYYESVYSDQLEHYQNTILKVNMEYTKQTKISSSKIPHIIFQHIPVEEFDVAYNDNSSIKLYGEKYENPCYGELNTGEFETVKNMGAKGIFVGHDHANNYGVNYKGIILSYDGQIGYSNGYLNDDSSKSGVLITICPNGSIKSNLVFVEK